jgi:hypothetical protein
LIQLLLLVIAELDFASLLICLGWLVLQLPMLHSHTAGQVLYSMCFICNIQYRSWTTPSASFKPFYNISFFIVFSSVFSTLFLHVNFLSKYIHKYLASCVCTTGLLLPFKLTLGEYMTESFLCIYCHGIFNPSSGTMAMGSTQPLTEMSTRNLPGG